MMEQLGGTSRNGGTTTGSACSAPEAQNQGKLMPLEQTLQLFLYSTKQWFFWNNRERPYTHIRARKGIWCLLFQREGADMREKQIEQKLVRAVRCAGGICPKLVSPGFDGMPDRMALLPGGRIGFVEVKAQGQKPRPLQNRRHGQLTALGFKVYVLDDTEQIPGIVREIGGNDGDDDHAAGRQG